MDFYLTTSASTLPCFQIIWKAMLIKTSKLAKVLHLQWTFHLSDEILKFEMGKNITKA